MQKMGWFGVVMVMGNVTIRQSAYDLIFDLIETMGLSFTVFQI